MTTDAAQPRKAVLNTPELLENIISFLPYTEILKVQRLSRQWQNTVASSPSIQTKLWLRPQHPTPIQPADFTNENTYPQPRSRSWGRYTMPIYSRDVEFNPICFDQKTGPVELIKASFKYDFLFRTANNTILHPRKIEVSFLSTMSNPHDQGSSSWRGMYLTDPPITTCILHVRNNRSFGGSGSPYDVQMAVRDQGGLTLGLVYDMVMAGLASSAWEVLLPDPARVATIYFIFE